MILYFADRFMNILGSANTALPKGIKIKDDLKTEEVETGIASFEFALPFDKETRAKIEGFLKAGNYILRSNEDENEFYTIVDGEIDTRSQDIYVYAEDAGLDLLNEIVGEYEASHAYPIEHYIEKFAKDSGFVIGINEIEDKSLQLSFDNEETATARIANIASLFNAEISYSFKVEGLKVVNKLINIHEKRGKDNGRQLRINKELDRIVTKYSITNLATALTVEGGTPDDAENPITLKGYSYDDGDFYIYGKRLYSRKALDNWSRYLWSEEPNQLSGYEGHIVKPFTSNALTQAELLQDAIAELKKLREIEVNYEIEFNQKPENVSIGDRVNVIDDDGELYLSTRLLKLETSVVNETFKATLGEFLLKDSGISSRVEQLASDFAKNSVDVKNAYIAAKEAKQKADEAKEQAEAAQTTAESVEIGGCNLLLNSTFEKGAEKWNVADDYYSINAADFGGRNSFEWKFEGATQTLWLGATQSIPNEKIKGNGKFTLSGWVYIFSDVEIDDTVAIEIKKVYKETNYHESYGKIDFSDIPKNKWVYFEKTYVLNLEEVDRHYVYFWIGKNGHAKITQLKFEKGNKVTDWTPAPEDTAVELSNLNDAVEGFSNLDIKVGTQENELSKLVESIGNLIKNGEDVPQMVYNEETQTWSFNTATIDENIIKHTEDIEALKDGVEEEKSNFENLRDRFNEWADKIFITTYENEPCLLLYEEGGAYKQYITNSRRIITETIEGVETVKNIVEVDRTTQNKVIAKESAQIGGFAWKKRDTNRIGLVWEGVIE